MKKALSLAKTAGEMGEVPVGAVIVKEGQIIGEGFNERESKNSPIAHAEITAIQKAAEKLQSWRLIDCTLYVTLEPCPMCAGAIINSRIPKVVFGAIDPKAGAAGSVFQILFEEKLNHRCEIISGCLAEESSELLKNFFSRLRRK